jgi:ankyrin repeat protein
MKTMKTVGIAWTIVMALLVCGGIARAGEIHDAAMYGDLDKVKALLNDNPNLVSSQDTNGCTPLYWAASAGHKDIAELLLAKGADVNAKGRKGYTPLHEAAMSLFQSTNLVELLLAKGADVNARNDDGQTPLHLAAIWGHKDAVELLLAKGADVNARTNKGQTPLQNATLMSHNDVADLLRQHGGTE